MAKFFIDRPVFAWVIAILIMLAGVLALRTLPIAQYPDVAPTTISVTGNYPGASAQAVENSVTQIIEQQMTGLDGLDYVNSTSSSDGTATITLAFRPGTDPDIAQVQVQNKLSLATPFLPEQVQRQGVTVSKASTGFLLITSLYSPGGTFDQTDLGDYVRSNMYDTVSRLDGVGSVMAFGSPYAIRVWLKPEKLVEYNLMPGDVVQAIRDQNAQIASGALGGAPSVKGQEINVTITLQSLLSTPEQFRNLLLLTTPEGGSVRLGDVADVEMGAENYAFISRFNGYPATGFAVSLATGANALDTAERVKETVEEMSHNFPEDMTYAFPVDSTPFIETSIHEVQKTLFEAIALVFIVIFVFLQSIRASFIPLIAVPVVLLGTFAVLLVMGMSINTLTMFAMVLAIGLLVDDAIVVVENVERVMSQDKLPPRQATIRSMEQITGALVGIAVVLSAVFIPMAFFPGSAGVIYRQFSVTIVSAMTLSVLVAIILSPALCATLLKPSHGEGHSLFSAPARIFNNGFDKLSQAYEAAVARALRRKSVMLVGFAAIVALTGFAFARMPSSFLPDEDQGSYFTLAQLPANATLERTADVMDEVVNYYQTNEEENVQDIFSLAGFSFAGQGQNNGIAFASLKDWSERPGKENSVQAIVGRAMGALSQIDEAQVFAISPPAIQELGNSSGFDLFLQNDGNYTHEEFVNIRNQLLGMASQDPRLFGVRPNSLEDGPQFNINLDYQKAQALGVSISDATNLLSVAFGGTYVNDFIDRGRIKRVYVQGTAIDRMQPDDVGDWFVRTNSGQMAPLDEIASTNWSYGPPQLQRFDGVPAFNIQGSAAPGQSSGVAMAAMEELISQLPDGVGYAWSGLSRQESESGNQAMALYGISVLFVFLCLAALYESWTVPISVLLVAPLGVAGAVAGAQLAGLSNDVFFQVGLLTTVGLASKNAILIIEFARSLENEGRELVQASIEAVRMRIRPVLMTSFAFGFGVLPLALSTGAGAAGRNAIGIIVLGGVIAAMTFSLLFAPVFYVIVRKITNRLSGPDKQAETPA
ncbi:efflux RND transporter permease subunit [uncultured Hyphomonas sp.]|uniref:efflux RND transporter permease subunit n=1 Tax=uncultured Hyphomonas sp. TaxID=225298 RepID=UPI002AAA8E44|nr:efflux RND transporter permease subunit [uncultured Hyphomonas sp.]